MAEEPMENEELELEEDFEEEDQQKSGGGLKKGLIIVAVQAVVAYFLATIVIVPMLVGKANASETQNSAKETSQEQVVDSSYTNVGPIFNVDDIIVNPANSDGERYVVVNMALELTSEEMQAEVEKRVPIIRDVAIQLLSSVPIDSMDGAENKLKLKNRFTSEIKKVLPPGSLRRVYFTSFIIQ
jgi:flagellar FliL protein